MFPCQKSTQSNLFAYFSKSRGILTPTMFPSPNDSIIDTNHTKESKQESQNCKMEKEPIHFQIFQHDSTSVAEVNPNCKLHLTF